MSTATGLDIHAPLAEMHTSFFTCALFHCTVTVLMTCNLTCNLQITIYSISCTFGF